jgi:hypothetical protein
MADEEALEAHVTRGRRLLWSAPMGSVGCSSEKLDLSCSLSYFTQLFCITIWMSSRLVIQLHRCMRHCYRMLLGVACQNESPITGPSVSDHSAARQLEELQKVWCYVRAAQPQDQERC